MYLDRTLSLPARPRSLFVSPRAPSLSLSKNALSFFLRSVIAGSYSSAGLPLPVVSSSAFAPSSSSSHPRSSLRAHGVRGVAASWTYLSSASLSLVLEVATWSSSVFTSFYLSDVVFFFSRLWFGSGGGCGFGCLIGCVLLSRDRCI